MKGVLYFIGSVAVVIVAVLLFNLSSGSQTEAEEGPPSVKENVTVEERAQTILEALREEDFEQVAEYVHSEKGVTFSPYAYVESEHQMFDQENLKNWKNDQSIYTWGTFDGSGYAIEVTPIEYYEQFIYDKDFASAEEVHQDEAIQPRGNSLHNAKEFYPDARFIEFHVPGSEEYGGMDWGSLIIAFEEMDGALYLIAIIHDQWTI
ncbi:hypothetical protein AJ85_11750 [Alkalihalobacillus alcalophilus ATCC 27647 = CGMCC 1.3604]|uniref:Uncharacterized protein n=1 Tax=Alkalihalobacillus alcalophilus ATCC 27647 = CGMCC 1.3604 TaxID=1218173 RepID=A0A4S4JYD4_ALKAL|nr:hypothetical protein [Alkalihalobacillus alcalophilus]MED1564204.1 hypothetical protein [Alkalihalobacillus alcalophilus]THG90273.1 hypothetical protein AJ85_11750 [Alkalihalobacillus alcalophilus ATCC 27647 = CGMCC 1.3604]